jgi:hypothetical protein
VYIFASPINNNTMSNENLKNKVIAKLIKLGNNESEALKMVDLHFN